MDINKFVRTLTFRKHYFNDSADELDTDEGSPNVQAVMGESCASPPSFAESCALCDLQELASESGPNSVELLGGYTGIPFRLRSDFYPITSWGKDMDPFQRLVERDLTHLARSYRDNPKPDNITSLEREALVSLGKDGNIAIRNVDKGGSIVVLE